MKQPTTQEAKMTAKSQTITIIANLYGGDYIVRSTLGGLRRMKRCELEAHRACGVTITSQRRLAQ